MPPAWWWRYELYGEHLTSEFYIPSMTWVMMRWPFTIKNGVCGFVVMSASSLLCVIVVIATGISPTFGLSDCEDQGESKLELETR